MVNKLFIDDWTRKGLSYKTFWEGDEYHIVKQKGDGNGMAIVTNHLTAKSPREEAKITKPFDGYSPRPDKVLHLHDARFDMINKDPQCCSKMKRVTQFSMTKQLDRPALLFGQTHTGTFYDSSKEKVMKRLTAGIPDMSKL